MVCQLSIPRNEAPLLNLTIFFIPSPPTFPSTILLFVKTLAERWQKNTQKNLKKIHENFLSKLIYPQYTSLNPLCHRVMAINLRVKAILILFVVGFASSFADGDAVSAKCNNKSRLVSWFICQRFLDLISVVFFWRIWLWSLYWQVGLVILILFRQLHFFLG